MHSTSGKYLEANNNWFCSYLSSLLLSRICFFAVVDATGVASCCILLLFLLYFPNSVFKQFAAESQTSFFWTGWNKTCCFLTFKLGIENCLVVTYFYSTHYTCFSSYLYMPFIVILHYPLIVTFKIPAKKCCSKSWQYFVVVKPLLSIFSVGLRTREGWETTVRGGEVQKGILRETL